MVRILRHFDYKDHLCLVFECMWNNARTVLKLYGRGKGLHLQAVMGYTKQLFYGLKLMRECKIVHADIKLDNILISENKQKLKLCDLGSAHYLDEVDSASYICSRWYRAVELCLCAKYDTQIDVWSSAVSVFEMYTGQFMFAGNSNNDMIRLFQCSLGKMPKKVQHMAEKGGKRHFTKDGAFVWQTEDRQTKKPTRVRITDFPSKNAFHPREEEKGLIQALPERLAKQLRPNSSSGHKRKAKQLVEFLYKTLMFDPQKRADPETALEHPFVAEKWVNDEEEALQRKADARKAERAEQKPDKKDDRPKDARRGH